MAGRAVIGGCMRAGGGEKRKEGVEGGVALEVAQRFGWMHFQDSIEYMARRRDGLVLGASLCIVSF